ncbi:MAG: undecaprenyl/decaprenyl-phosphate alpha-N-acetylglucosaminyl 1-phosphate transferase [Candidatus Eremiobacteraeota bacterium]|nr:undecaprenyl/decaprenyl-phosphate alpha-N-acetylglucosaminyl 1-phosphate transferase [Candidatus Eremiobacteraeota bacterium]MBC5803369.1 undecaprenyl/decaprenyl-phosphate alpha-N-acetylglucosaminyl 1-phosphate transferase [Candidatus Eremiobacteraeota bacterium]MBC5821969.1 undecaprenyl/decaprenyl-phosphate alpha-N-acetylglucosaminyl 1-phosphate transferase [Candidatus Eremiobacteraeota bacterium]
MSLPALYALATVTAFVTAFFATPQIRKLALKVGVLDAIGERRMHAEPKPRIGGIAVYLGLAAALFVTIGFALHTSLFHSANDTQDFFGLLFGGTLIMLVGVWDDIMGMRPRNKFVAQIVVAIISMIYGFHIGDIRVPGGENYLYLPPWIDYPLTLVWYLGMMNAINFLDGLDGLLSGVAAISGVFLFAIASMHGHVGAALVLCALVGGALGFLPYNFNPAKIFLGDTGSLFIGYVFATVSLLITAKVAVTVSLLVPLVALALPLADTAAAIVRRMRAGRAVTEADRGHFHHLLVFHFGLGVKQAVLLIYGVSFLLGMAAYLLSGGAGHPRIAGLV